MQPTETASSTDPLARTLVRDHIMPAGLDVAFGRDNILCRSWFMLPFEHSEDLADQERAVELCRDIRQHVRPEMREVADLQLDAALKHRDLIQRFGRCAEERFSLACSAALLRAEL